jgi:hypothetical protein
LRQLLLGSTTSTLLRLIDVPVLILRRAQLPVRPWVLSPPIPLHLLLTAQPELVTPVLQVVPQGPEAEEQVAEAATASECECRIVQGRPHRISWVRPPKRVLAAT